MIGRCLVRALTDRDADVRYVAALWSDRAGEHLATGPALAAALEDADDRVRCDAARSLGQMGLAARAAAPALRRALGDEDETVIFEAALALALVSGEPDLPVAVLREAWRRNPSDQSYLEAFAKIGPGAAPALPEILRELDESNSYAVAAVRSIGPAAAAAVPRLLEMVRDGNGEAAEALAAMGPAARETVAALLAMLAAEDATWAASTALAEQG